MQYINFASIGFHSYFANNPSNILGIYMVYNGFNVKYIPPYILSRRKKLERENIDMGSKMRY